MSEEQLQYGFRQQPKDLPSIKPCPNVPEEKLFAVDRTIVELNPPPKHRKDKHDDDKEGEEEDEEHEEKKDERHSYRHLHYSDIGYFPAKCTDGKFVVQKPPPCELSVETKPKFGCSGFRPGKIVTESEAEEDDDDGQRW